MLNISKPRRRDKTGWVVGIAASVFDLKDAGQGVGLADRVEVGVDNAVCSEGANIATVSATLPMQCFCNTQTCFLAIHFPITMRASLIC